MKLFPALCAIATLTFAGSLYAESIGINFVGKEEKAQTLDAKQKAGVEAVEQTNWNHVSVSNDDANGHNNSSSLEKVKDGAGKDVKDASVRIEAKSDTQVWPNNGSAWGFADANLVLQSGMLSPSPTITIKGIPYKKYDVYVYAAAGDNGGQGSATITAGKDSGKVDSVKTYFVNFNWQNGTYVKSEAKTLEEAKASKGSNYVVFTGNTAKDIVIDFKGTLGGGWIGVAAVQIVESKDASK